MENSGIKRKSFNNERENLDLHNYSHRLFLWGFIPWFSQLLYLILFQLFILQLLLQNLHMCLNETETRFLNSLVTRQSSSVTPSDFDFINLFFFFTWHKVTRISFRILL